MTAQEREEELCNLFAEVLGIPEIDPQDSFFDLGGTSMLASGLTRRIHASFGIKVPIRRLYDASTPAALAQHLAGAV